MKKTLITLIVASSCAVASSIEDAYWGISNYDGTSSVFDINNTESPLTLSADYVVTGATFSTNITNSPYSKRVMYAVTYVLNLAELDTPTTTAITLFSDYNKDTSTGVGFALTSDRTLAGTWGSSVWTPNTNKGQTNFAIELGNSGTSVITFVMGYDDAGADVYINGEAAGSAIGLSHSATVTKLKLNGSEAIESIYFHKFDDSNLFDATAAANLYSDIAASIPEPTTATLSLLALAGLAARRRRR